MARYLVGVAWPYANGPIHLGHVAGSLLPPDIFARYHRMCGDEVLMVSGSDEHGTPITVTAEKKGVSPEEIAQKFHKINSKAIEDLGISFDLYFETSHENHKKVVHDIFLRLLEKEHIYKKVMLSPFCSNCQKFLPDRYVEGECPHCGHGNARGDQCDECGRTLDPEELIEPLCKFCSSTPEMKETEHFFFKLSGFQGELERYVADKDHWRHNTKNFTKNWLESGLRDRAITRDIKWGVEIPLEGYDDKRIYVWFEAVIGYFSTSKEWARKTGNEEKWQDFWMNETCKHYYFLGKDNIPFHTIIWPAILMGYGGLNLPYDVPANEYLKWGGEQFSKSRGISISIPDILQKYDPDQVRYYLSINMPEIRDAEFTLEDFIRRNNDELVSTLGNFIHRTLSFTQKNYGEIPEAKELTQLDKEALEKIKTQVEEVSKLIEGCEFKKAIKSVMELAHFGNRYFDARAPWALLKENREECGTALNICCRIVKALCISMSPFLPFSADRLWDMMGYEGSVSELKWGEATSDIKAGQVLSRPTPLFKKLELKDVEEKAEEKKPEKEEEITIDALKLRIGEIEHIEDHPNAEKLYIMKVNFGDEKRQLVAGLKTYYTKEEMQGRKIIVVMNLKPAKLRGIESKGMLLAAEDKSGIVSLLSPLSDEDVGVEVIGRESEPGNKKKQISFSEFQKIKLKVGTITQDEKADIGIQILGILGGMSTALAGKQFALTFVKGQDEVMPLVTENGGYITVHRPVENGAEIK
ncbi:MAG: methionine--tRNA ligase [Methanomassiliicoccales archaeon]|nr:MAG: methionine--tRNA ligase [Methanomassiliicoccales archaeon]